MHSSATCTRTDGRTVRLCRVEMHAVDYDLLTPMIDAAMTSSDDVTEASWSRDTGRRHYSWLAYIRRRYIQFSRSKQRDGN